MTTTDTAHSAETAGDVVSEDANIDAANEKAKQTLATSRYDAFRLVTEARKEAETILDEARSEAAGIAKAAEITAQSKIGAAENQAVAIIEEARQRSTEHTHQVQTAAVSGEAALESEHRELSERVSSLRVLADQLEKRFAALAATASGSDAATTPVSTLDYSPSVQPAPSEPAPEILPAEDDPERGSFYSRRSAKLPSIGAAGGQSALDMTRSIRKRLEND